VGSEKAVAMLEAALKGEPRENLISLLEEMGDTLAKTSICGLGQVALAPVLSVIRNFPESARARLDGRGPAGGGKPDS
jgi:formate dehydrogenase